MIEKKSTIFRFTYFPIICWWHFLLSDILPKCAEQWHLIDDETKKKLTNEYHENLKKYSEDLEQYNLSLTDAQRLHLETATINRSKSKEKQQLKLDNKKTGKPSRPVNPYGLFVKEFFSKIPKTDSENLNEPVSIEQTLFYSIKTSCLMQFFFLYWG